MAIYTAEQLNRGVITTEEITGATDFIFTFPDRSGSLGDGSLETKPYQQNGNYFFRRYPNTNDPGDIVVGTNPTTNFGSSVNTPGFIFASIEDNTLDTRGLFSTFTLNPTINEGGIIIVEDVIVYQTGGSTTDSGARCKIAFQANTVVQIAIEQENGMLSDYTAGTIQWTQAQVNAFAGVSGATSGLQFTLPATSLYRKYGIDSPEFTAVPFVGGSGTNARATQIIVSNNIVESVKVGPNDKGTGYKRGDVISIPATAVGGTGTALSFTLTAKTLNSGFNSVNPNLLTYFTFESIRNENNTYSGSVAYGKGVKSIYNNSKFILKPTGSAYDDGYIWSSILVEANPFNGSGDENTITWTPDITIPIGKGKLIGGGDISVTVV